MSSPTCVGRPRSDSQLIPPCVAALLLGKPWGMESIYTYLYLHLYLYLSLLLPAVVVTDIETYHMYVSYTSAVGEYSTGPTQSTR